MAGGGKVRIIDRDNSDAAHTAKVTNGRLWVTTGGGGGAAGDVNLVSIGGVPVTTPLAVTGTVTVGGTVAVTQSTSPWVVSGTVAVSNFPATQPVSGTVTVLQGTNPWTVDGTVNVGNFPATVAVTQSTSPWVVSGAVTVGGTVAVTQSTSPWVVSGTVNIGNTPILVDQNLPPWSVTVASIVPGTGATNLGKAEDAVHASGDVGVATWAVRQDTASALAANGDYIPHTTDALGNLRVGGASSTGLGKAEDAAHVGGDVGVMALTVIDNAAAGIGVTGDYTPLRVNTVGQLRTIVEGVVPGTLSANLGKAEDSPHTSTDVGVMALAVRDDTGIPSAANGDYIPLSINAHAALRTDLTSVGGNLIVGANVPINGTVTVTSQTPGTGATNLGKAEDAASTGGETGVLAISIRRDALVAGTSSPSTDGDYGTLSIDSVGALWVRNKGDTVTTIPFSASTRGRPVQITATVSAGTTIHTATTTAGQIDRMYLALCNTSASSVTVTIEFGTTGVGNEIDVVVPANETVVALDGVVIGGAATDTVAAYASTGSVVNAVGRVERLAA